MKTAAERSGQAEAARIPARNGGSARLAPRPYGLAFADLSPGLIIGHADDHAEREADALAERAIAGLPVPRPAYAMPAIRRACAACAEEEQFVRRKADGGGDALGGRAAPPTVSSLLAQPGQALDPGARRYFEGRFGGSFANVAVHDGPAADEAARSIGARAFTAGPHIAFARGQYAPGTRDGMRLLAHELTHVLQQRGGTPPVVRRATYGAGAAPYPTWAPVPANERAHVGEALAKVDAVVADPATYRECHEQYATRCPGGTPASLATIWNRARIWRDTEANPDANASAPVNGSDIGYTSLGYSQNVMGLAKTLMHEGGHNCGIPGGDTHWHAALIAQYCMTPGQNSFSISAGPSLTGGDPTMLLSYRRFLGDWAGGRLRATLGADFNLIGTILEARQPPEAHEFGSITGGVQVRAGGWGGTRYGGISFRLETGIGAGRFALPPTPGGEPRTEIMPDVIMQVGPRAEFLIPTGDAHVFPLSVGAAYRLAQPLNSEASALHTALFTLEANF